MKKLVFSTMIVAALFASLLIPRQVCGQERTGDRISAASDREPTWLLMINGREAFEEGNYGTALSLFRHIVEREPSNADAHLWIGYVFEAEGEYELAKRKYLQSLEYERMFAPYEGRIAARYALARAAEKLGEDDLYMETLEDILRLGRSEDTSDALIDAMVEKMLEQGPDKVLELYRIREKRVRRAYGLAAEESLSRENYEEAVHFYTVSFAITMTTAIEAMQHVDTEYSFIREELPVTGSGFYIDNTRRFLDEAEDIERIAEYFRAIEWYRELFLFACALYGAGHAEKATDLWLLTMEHRESGVWSALAREQAAEPDLGELPAILER